MTRRLLSPGLGLALASCAYLTPEGVLGGLVSNSDSLAKKGAECERIGKFEVPANEEVAVGGAVAVSWVKKGGGLVIGPGPKDDLTLYVNRVGRNLAMQSARPYLDWTFGVLDSNDFNATSAPGGYVFVTRGLLKAVENEAQLAGVLGHEIAHVTQKHAVNAYRTVKKESCDFAYTTMMFGAATEDARRAFDADRKRTDGVDLNLEANYPLLSQLANNTISTLLEKGFSQVQEYEADRIGLQLALSAGYNPHEYVKFLAKVPQAKSAFPHHPSNADRQAKLTAYLGSLKGTPLHPDWPFDQSPVVPLKDELAAAK